MTAMVCVATLTVGERTFDLLWSRNYKRRYDRAIQKMAIYGTAMIRQPEEKDVAIRPHKPRLP